MNDTSPSTPASNEVAPVSPLEHPDSAMQSIKRTWKMWLPISIGILITLFTATYYIASQQTNKAETNASVTPSPTKAIIKEETKKESNLITPTTSVTKKISPTPFGDGITVVGVTVVPNQTTPVPTNAPQNNIVVGVNGIVYADQNCNGNREANEGTIPNVTINVFKNPEFSLIATKTTTSNGSYEWSTSIPENSSIGVEVAPVSPEGYKSNPKHGSYAILLKSDYRTATYNLPQVPNENVGSCY